MSLSQFDRQLEDGSIERYCPCCKEWKPKDEHFLKTAQGRRELCTPCYRLRQNEKRSKLVKAACTQLVKQLVSGKVVEQIEVPHTSELASHVVKGFGGVEGLAEMYVNAAKASYAENPTSKVTLEWMKVTKDLVVKSTEQRESAPDVAQMDEDELNNELAVMIGRLMESNPELLDQIADQNLIETGDGSEE